MQKLSVTVLLLSVLINPAATRAVDAGPDRKAVHPPIDYLSLVTAYAEAMLKHGRDRYGEEHSPLFASALNRKNMRVFAGDEAKDIWAIRLRDWPNWQIRNRDRCLRGANIQHDTSLLRILYGLTEVTEEPRWAAEADRTIKWFFEHCQSPTTGLLAWGEHMGWDFHTEKIIWKEGMHNGGLMRECTTHEFYRHWPFWDRSFDLAPEACLRFARGLWDHQIADQETGNFSRHADYLVHQVFKDSEYPRHGGYIIATWGEAYERSRDPVYLKALDTLVTYYDGRRSPISGAFPAESSARSKGKALWLGQNLTLAMLVWEAADKVPDDLAWKFRRFTLRTDEVFLGLPHDFSDPARGFANPTHIDTLALSESQPYLGVWGAAGTALACLARHEQVGIRKYRELALSAARRLLEAEPDAAERIKPGPFVSPITLMAKAYRLTRDKAYLERAEQLAATAVGLFLDDGLPLPKATIKYHHYEAVSGAPGLMEALLELWTAKHRPAISISRAP